MSENKNYILQIKILNIYNSEKPKMLITIH